MNDVNAAENSFVFTEVDSSINLFNKQFGNPLLNTHVQISVLQMECKSLQHYIKESLKVVGVTEYSNILKLDAPCLTFMVANAKVKLIFSI